MRRFLKYPVYVNHPGRWEEVRQQQIEEYRQKRDKMMFVWLHNTAKDLYATIDDPNPPAVAVTYEKAVIDALNIIVTTPIGRLLLSALDQNTRYWIHPLDGEGKESCQCGAYTFPGAPKEGGGIRIYYNPSDYHSAARRWISVDDVLFHELVHAYRMGRWGYETVNHAPDMGGWGDSEEFLATQMQNVYLSQRGGTHFYRSYPGLERASKGDAYQALRDDQEALGQLNFFVNTDSVVGIVAGWMTPATSFNSFRDRTTLGRMGGMP